MTRINALSSKKDTNSMTWGKTISAHAGVLFFAAVLIVCSVTVGCSSDNPKPVSSNNQIPVTQPQMQPMPAPVVQAESKPVPKKVVHRKPPTANYSDKASGLTFEYPRRYAIETGDAAAQLLLSHPIPMNFVEPGGVALAAVELPETGYANTDFSSAFFNVSVHKTLTADQCAQFSVPQPAETKTVEQKPADMTEAKTEAKPEPAPATPASTEVAMQDSAPKSDSKPDAPSAPAQPPQNTDQTSAKASTPSSDQSNSRLMLGDLALLGTEAVSGQGTRQSDSKYFHVYQNGACYEFALNVTTDASEEGIVKHVDRDKVFNRLAQILATVKINPVAAPEVTAEAPNSAIPATPAQ